MASSGTVRIETEGERNQMRRTRGREETEGKRNQMVRTRGRDRRRGEE